MSTQNQVQLGSCVHQTQAVEALLAAGADAHAAATDDTSSLHFAAQKGHTDVVKLLMGKGAIMTANVTLL